MHDIHQAIEALRAITGQPGLELGQGDHAEIVFDETPVGIVATDRHHLELVTPLKDLTPILDQATLARLMTANYLGTATGSARLALDPGRQQIVLCERLDVRILDDDGLRDRVVDFLDTAAFWNGNEGREALVGPVETASEHFATDHLLIRG